MDSSIHAHTPPKPKSSPGWMITIAAAAAFLATFNETFLNVAFAPIMADFGVDVNTVQWLNHWLSFSCRNLCASSERFIPPLPNQSAVYFSNRHHGCRLHYRRVGTELCHIAWRPTAASHRNRLTHANWYEYHPSRVTSAQARYEHGDHGRDDNAWPIAGNRFIRRFANHRAMEDADVGIRGTCTYRAYRRRLRAVHSR